MCEDLEVSRLEVLRSFGGRFLRRLGEGALDVIVNHALLLSRSRAVDQLERTSVAPVKQQDQFAGFDGGVEVAIL